VAKDAVIADVLVNPTNSPQTVTYTVVPVNPVGGCAAGPSKDVVITVEPTPKAAINDNGVIAICDGENVNIDITTVSNPSVPGTILYDLVVTSTDDVNTGGSAYTDLNDQSFTPSPDISGDLINNSNVPITVRFTVTPKIGSCVGASVWVDIIVYPSPELTSAAATVCSGSAATAAPVSNVAGSTFSWEITFVSNVYGVTFGQTGSGATFSELLYNDGTNGTDGTSPGTVVYTVTPKNSVAWGECEGIPTDVTITVNPETRVTITQAEYFIAAGDIVNISGTIEGGTNDGTWSVVSAPNEGVFGNPDFNNTTANSTTFDPSDTQDGIGSVIIRLTSDDPDGPGGPCTIVWYEAIIHIGALPTADAGSPQTICEPSPATITLVGRIGGSGTSGFWSAPALTGTFDAPSVSAKNDNGTPMDPDDDYYTVTQVYNLNPAELAAPSDHIVWLFTLTSNDPDGAGPVPPATDNVDYTIQTGPHTPAIGGGGAANMCLSNATGQFYSVPFTSGNRYNWSVTGGVNGTDFLIQLGTGGISQNFIVLDYLEAGSYTIRITEETPLVLTGSWCVGSEVTKPINVYPGPTAIAGVDATICAGESITLGGNPMIGTNPSASGGSGTYTYQWMPGIGLDNNTAEHPVASPLSTRTYSLVVTDVITGCQSVQSDVEITVNPLPTLYTVSGPAFYCFGTAGVTITLSNSQTDVTYELYKDGNPTTETRAGTTGSPLTWIGQFIGTYTVEAVDDNTSCTRFMAGSVTVAENPDITMTTNLIENVKCFGGNEGKISITPSGGTAPFSFLWSGPAAYSSTNEDITGLYAGDYTVTITDVRGCEYTSGIITVTEPDALALTSVLETQAVTCFGGSDGEAEATVDITTGTAPYTYQWYYNAALSSPVPGAITATLSGVAAGTYYVLVLDANLCTVSGSVTITQPTQMTGSGLVTTPVSCNGVSDAVITVTVSGGSGSYEYDLNGADAWQALNTFGGLGDGTYTLRVRDALATGCIVNLANVVVTQPDVLTISGSVTSNHNGSQISCPTSTDGTITVVGAGGTTVYQYNIDGGAYQVSPVFSGLGANTYTMGILDARGCTATTSVTITAPVALSGTAAATSDFSGFNIRCNGGSDGIIEVNVTGGTGTLRYSLDGGAYQLSNTFTGLSEGSYDITVRDANLCTFDILNVPVTEPTLLAISSVLETQAVTCYGGNDGEAEVVVSAGTGAAPYTYQWYYNASFSNPVPGAITSTLSGVPAATYYILVKDANLCTAGGSVDITQPPQLTVTKDGQTNILCFGDATGTINVTSAGGFGAHTFTWTGTDYLGVAFNSTDEDLTGLKAGSYNLIVEDANNCTVTLAVVNITQPADLTVTLNATTNVLCHDASTGAIYITVNGGVQPVGGYFYTWTGTDYLGAAYNSTSEDLTGLKAGTYSLQVADNNGCVVPLVPDVVITQPADMTVVLDGKTDNLCYNDASGTIDVTVAGGVYAVDYSYVWTGSDYLGTFFSATTEDLTGLKAGTYNLTVRDDNNCTVSLATVTIAQPTQLTVTKNSQTNVLCHDDITGEIAVTVGGGTAPYDYAWTGTDYLGNAFASTSEDLTGLKAGTYNLTVTDDNGCSVTLLPVSITQPADMTVELSGQTDVLCFGASTGAIFVTVSGGVKPAGGYIFTWTGLDYLGAAYSSSVEDPSGLKAGDYDLTVEDANNCTVTLATVTISHPPALTVAFNSKTDVLCYGASTGAINVTAGGGVMPAGGYYYTWTGTNYLGNPFSSNLEDLTGLVAGTYNLTVKDANNCSVTLATVTITHPLPFLVTKDGQTNVLCHDDASGSIDVTVTGGVGPYDYAWTGTDYLGVAYSNIVDEDLTGLKAGTYNLTVTDANLCSVSLAAVVITQPADLTVSLTSQTNILCHDDATGAINVTVAGGVTAYAFTWTGNDYLGNPYNNTSEDLAGLKAGTYNLSIEDANGCIVVLPPVVITQPADLTVTLTGKTDVLCHDANTGAINVTVAGGVMPVGGYFFTWTGTNYLGVPFSSNLEDLTGLKAGNYDLSVRDANNCIVILTTVNISQPADLTVALTSKTNVLCHDAATGAIDVTVTGGVTAYTYAWTGTDYLGAAYSSASEDPAGLKAGSYNLTVTDLNLCTVTLATVTITQPADLVVNLTSQTNVQCFGDATGSINVTVTGGVMPAGNYIFVWSGTDYLGAAYNSIAEDPSGLKAGEYSLLVTDANSCQVTLVPNVTISQSDPLTPGSIKNDQILCYGFSPVAIQEDLAATGGPVTPYNYQWQVSFAPGGPYNNIPGATSKDYTPPVTPNTSLYYKRVVTSGLCPPVISNEISVIVNPLPIAELKGGEIICLGQTSILKVEITAGAAPFEIEIDNLGIITGYTSNADIPVTPASTTTYTLLRVKDANGCEVTSLPNVKGTATVTVKPLPAISVSPVDKTICEYSSVNFSVTANIESEPVYQWYVKKTAVFELIPEGGVYSGTTTATLSIFGASREMNGYVYHAVVSSCATNVTSGDAILTINTAPQINVQPKDSTICYNNNATFEVEAEGTALTYQWQYNPGSGFINVPENANFSGTTTNILVITNAPGTFNNYSFRVRISGSCPAPVNSNIVVLKVDIAPSATIHPSAKVVCENGGPIVFIGNGTGKIDSLRWQVNTGSGWSDIYDDPLLYSGTASQQLTLSNVPVTSNGHQFRLALKAKCATATTNPATLTVNANPIVDFSANDTIHACGNIPLMLDGNPSGGSGVYSQHIWTGDVGPLNNYFIQKPTFNSQISATYDLTYRVTDSKGCSASDDLVVIVDSPDATFTQDLQNGCTPITVSFTKDMTGLSKFWWDFGDGSPLDSLNANPAHTFTNNNPASIEYRSVKLRVMSPGGCYDTFTSMVTVYPAVNATFTASDTIVCSGNSLTFTTSPGASKYFWDYGDGITGYSATETTTHLYTNFTTAPQYLTVKLTTTSFYNCMDEMEMKIKVMPVPQAQFLAVPPSQIYSPAGNPVTFTNQTNEGSWTYLWRFGDGATSADRDPAHTYTALGTYDVVLRVNNANCSDSITHKVYVLPPPPVANFDSIPSGCEPWTITINNTSLNTDVPGTTYRWNFGDGSISTAKNPVYTYFDAGIFRVELTVTGPGGTSTKSQVVSSYPSPRAYFEVSPMFVFVNDEQVRAFNLSQGADSYLWEFGDGDTSKVKEPFHKYMEAGVYDITLWAYSNNGCTDKFVLSPGVTVEPAGEVRFSTVFTPNMSGPIERSSLPTGGTEIDQFFFPPIREKVIDYKLQVFNRLGVLIFESRDINVPWNGYYRGQLCSQGVYVWYVEGKYANGQPFKKVGDVTLLH
jgi:PKD repeat protein/predicted heme/steroid binding protein